MPAPASHAFCADWALRYASPVWLEQFELAPPAIAQTMMRAHQRITTQVILRQCGRLTNFPPRIWFGPAAILYHRSTECKRVDSVVEMRDTIVAVDGELDLPHAHAVGYLESYATGYLFAGADCVVAIIEVRASGDLAERGVELVV